MELGPAICGLGSRQIAGYISGKLRVRYPIICGLVSIDRPLTESCLLVADSLHRSGLTGTGYIQAEQASEY